MSTTLTFPLKYRRKSSPPPSPRMLSPIAPFSPPPKWLDSDDDLDHEPALTSDDALTVLSSSWSRAPSLAPLDTEDPHVDIVSSPVREVFFRAPSSRAPLSTHNKSYAQDTKSSATREDVAAALLALHSQPRLGPSSRPVLPRPPPQIEVAQPPPPRRPRVITPSLRNLVLPRTPSPPPRPSLPLPTRSPVIDRRHGHANITGQRTPSRHATPASSPLPPSSPFAEEADCDVSQPIAFYSVPCSKPKSEPLQARTLSDELEADKRSQAWSRDNGPKGECDEVPRAPPSLEASLVTVAAPNERDLAHKSDPSTAGSSAALSPKVVRECEILSPTSDGPNGESQLHGSRTETMVSAAPSPPASSQSSALPVSPSHDAVDQPAVLPSYSRAASSTLTALDDEHSVPSSPLHDGLLASSPLSSPPSSPSPDQRREAPSSSFVTGAGTKRRATTPLLEPDPDVTSISVSASLGERACTRTKRRRKDMDSDDDKPRRNRKSLSRASAPAQQPHSTLGSTQSPTPASPLHASTSTSTTIISTSAASSSSSATNRNPHDADANDAKSPDRNHDNNNVNDDEEIENQPCPHPALLGILVEALALSRASSLPLSTLTRTNPALAEYPHAVLTSTLTWAVRCRILGCVRSSGEAVPPSYFYDPAADPDRERGDLLRCLMPRAGKRRETMKYKQYYWAPVVLGRGRTRTWDVDWEE